VTCITGPKPLRYRALDEAGAAQRGSPSARIAADSPRGMLVCVAIKLPGNSPSLHPAHPPAIVSGFGLVTATPACVSQELVELGGGGGANNTY